MCNIKYLSFENFLELFENDNLVYRNILTKVAHKEESLQRGDIFEIFANYDCFKKHIPLISTCKKITGYDGIFIDQYNKIYFMEAKFHKTTFNEMHHKANKTIDDNKDSRNSEIENILSTLINVKNNISYGDPFNYSCFSPLRLYSEVHKNKVMRKIENDSFLDQSITKLNSYLESLSTKGLKHKIEDEHKVLYLGNHSIDDKLTKKSSVREAICVTIKQEEI